MYLSVAVTPMTVERIQQYNQVDISQLLYKEPK